MEGDDNRDRELPRQRTRGAAASTKKNQTTALKSLDTFLLGAAKYNKHWVEIPGAVMADEVVWSEYAYWLVNESGLTSGGTITEYLRTCMREVREHHKRAKDPGFMGFMEFFAEALDRSDTWFKDMVMQCAVDKFVHATEEGGSGRKQAEPLYCEDRRAMSEALRKHGSADSQLRNLIVHLLGAAAGRPGEVVALSPDVMEWDKMLEAEFCTWPQFKTHKFKQVGIFAGGLKQDPQ
jgi:hypothetical protein